MLYKVLFIGYVGAEARDFNSCSSQGSSVAADYNSRRDSTTEFNHMAGYIRRDSCTDFSLCRRNSARDFGLPSLGQLRDSGADFSSGGTAGSSSSGGVGDSSYGSQCGEGEESVSEMVADNNGKKVLVLITSTRID